MPMTMTFAFEPMPEPWSISESRDAAGRPQRRLRIGAREIAVADIATVAEERVTARDIEGLALIGAAFAMLAVLALIGVVALGWRERFLIGSAVLAGLAAASWTEVAGLRPIRYRRLHITTRSGARLVLASADDREVEALAAALGVRLGG